MATNNFNKGLFTDSREFYQPDGTYPFSLNSVEESINGSNNGSIINEEGNLECLNLPKGSNPIGSILLSQNELILFINNPDAILLVNTANCTYTTLIQNTCLNFTKQVQGVYRVINGCDRIIYFVDGVNDDRVINIDDIIRNPTSHNYLNKFGVFDCELIKNKRNFDLACVKDITVNNTGGNLELGVYQIILQYEDNLNNGENYFAHSLPIPIAYGNYNADYKDVIGGDPLTFPQTTKSITFTIAGIDQTYAYLNILVVHTKNQIKTCYIVDKLSIVENELVYTLTDLTTTDSEQIPIDKVIVSQNPYKISETIAQIDNRLIKGNSKQTVRDYAEFQRLANNVEVTYVTKPILYPNSDTKSGLSKSSKSYSDYRTYMRDEIYSLGLVWVFKDGSETPAFPIPGRQKNISRFGLFPASDSNTHSRPNNNTGVGNTEWDSALILAGTYTGPILSPSEEYKHLLPEDFIKDSGNLYVERWQAYNTAYRKTLNNASSNFYSTGDLAYFESNYRYPLIKDCSDNYIYPIEQDSDGNVIGAKITHHKMPDTTLEEHFTTSGGKTYILPLGLKFDNISFPSEYSSEIAGYYIVREQRTENNKTILDKGIIHENAYFTVNINDKGDKDYFVQTTVGGRHHREENAGGNWDRAWIPNKSSIDVDCGNTVTGTLTEIGPGIFAYLIENNISYNHKSQSFHGPVSKFLKPSFNTSLFKIERILTGKTEIITSDNQSINDLSRYHYNTDYTSSSVFNTSDKQTNISLEKNPIYINPHSELPLGYLSKAFINSCSQETCVFESKDPFYWISQNDTQNDVSLTEGNEYDANVFYGSLKNYNKNIYGQAGLQKYFKTHTCMINKNRTSTVQFGGDCFITKFSFFKSAYTKLCSCYGCNTGNSEDFEVDKNMITYFVESEVNTELRHYDINNLADNANTFWDFFNGTLQDFFNIDWNGFTFNDDPLLGAGAPWNQNLYMKNLYLYNRDYSMSDTVKPYFSLESNYQYCKECAESFPQRIHYSETGNQEEKSDNYRIFYANNYRDLPAHTGPITNLFINFDDLYAHTALGLYKIITKPYQINTNQATLYVGTGEFFSVPPRQLVSVDYGYAGSTQKFATKATEHGTIFVDDSTGKIFMLTDQLKEISLEGMRNWFEENLELKFNKQYKQQYGVDYNLKDQPALPNGVGVLTTFDPRHKRVLITKIDYEALNTIPETIDFTDTSKFKNNSWTISYSLLSNTWRSWHSYLPNFGFNDSNNFYTSINSVPKIWKHNQLNFQTYYGKKHPHVIEYIIKDNLGQTKTLDTISYISKVEEWNSNTKQWIDKDYETFDNIIAYNTYQSTGKRQIEVKQSQDPFANLTTVSNKCFASKTEKNWNINNFRDYIGNRNTSLFTSNWNDIKTDYYIDKVPNTSAFNFNKSPFELEMLRDKYFSVRLFYKPVQDYKITTDIFSGLNNDSYR